MELIKWDLSKAEFIPHAWLHDLIVGRRNTLMPSPKSFLTILEGRGTVQWLLWICTGMARVTSSQGFPRRPGVWPVIQVPRRIFMPRTALPCPQRALLPLLANTALKGWSASCKLSWCNPYAPTSMQPPYRPCSVAVKAMEKLLREDSSL